MTAGEKNRVADILIYVRDEDLWYGGKHTTFFSSDLNKMICAQLRTDFVFH